MITGIPVSRSVFALRAAGRFVRRDLVADPPQRARLVVTLDRHAVSLRHATTGSQLRPIATLIRWPASEQGPPALIGATVALAALGTTWLVSDFRLYQLALAGVLAIAMLGLNILTGFNGQISLGHGAFIGIGSYTAAILVRDARPALPIAIATASVTCFVVGCLIGVPALRLPGSSLALVTLGFALALPQAIKKFDGLTGGAYGIYLPFDEQFNSPWAG